MSLIPSAKLNGLQPWVHLNGVLTMQPADRIAELLPHRWAQPN